MATAMGCPVLCQMDSVEIGRSLVRSQPVFLDKNAAGADGILLFNRIKPHTSYTGRYESGLMKMMAIGLGKQKGAESIHSQSPAIMMTPKCTGSIPICVIRGKRIGV